MAWYRAQGFPTNSVELNAWYPQPKGDNAADVYLDAFNAYPPYDTCPTLCSSPDPALGTRLSVKQAKEVRAVLRPWSIALGYLAKAAAMPECRFPVDATRGAPHLDKLCRAQGILALRGLLLAGEGKTEQALDDVRTLLGMARSLDNDLTDEAPWRRLGIVQTAATALERALNLGSASAERLRQVAECTRPARIEPAFTRTAVRMALKGNETIRDRSPLVVPRGYLYRFPLIAPVICGAIGMSDMDRAAVLRVSRRAIETMRDPRKAPASLMRALFRLAGDLPRFELGPDYSGWPICARYVEIHRVATLRVMRAALAVERYRLKLGHMPAALKDTTPEFLKTVPLDPFDAKPLRYRKLKRGFVVYSVGGNGKEEGGKRDDISFRVIR